MAIVTPRRNRWSAPDEVGKDGRDREMEGMALGKHVNADTDFAMWVRIRVVAVDVDACAIYIGYSPLR